MDIIVKHENKEPGFISVPVSFKEMLAYKHLFEWCREQVPYMDPALRELLSRFTLAIASVCPECDILIARFVPAEGLTGHPVGICPQCCPDLFDQYMEDSCYILDRKPGEWPL